MPTEINRTSVLVSKDGGILDIVSGQGEVLSSIWVPPGRIRASYYLDLVPQGATLEIAEGIACFPPRSAVGIQAYGRGSHDSGANPDFRPLGNAEQLQRQMQLAVQRMNQATGELRREARARKLAEIAAIPRAPVLDPVIEEIPQPVVTPEAAQGVK